MNRRAGEAELVIGRVETRDLPAITEIEAESFPSPWDQAMYLHELGEPSSVFLAARSPDDLVGYVCARYLFEEGHVFKIAVRPSWRRRGVAGRLMARLTEEFKRRAVEVIWLEVRERNLAAQEFYAGLGFEAVGRRRRYYSDTGEDAIVLMRRMD